MAAYDDLNVKRIFVVGVASIVITAVTALAVQVLYYSMALTQERETLEASSYARQNEILAQQFEQVSKFGVDETTGNIVVPVDKAIEKMVREASAEDDLASPTGKESHEET